MMETDLDFCWRDDDSIDDEEDEEQDVLVSDPPPTASLLRPSAIDERRVTADHLLICRVRDESTPETRVDHQAAAFVCSCVCDTDPDPISFFPLLLLTTSRRLSR